VKKVFLVFLVLLILSIGNFIEISASDQLAVGEKSELVSDLELNLQLMREVFRTHHIIECNSKESRDQFINNNDLREIYDETCKIEKENSDKNLEKEKLFINSNIDLVKSFVGYDIVNDSFYIDLAKTLETGGLNDGDIEILELVKFYFESDFEVNSIVIEEAVAIVYDNEDQIVLKSVSYGSWTEYGRYVNYAKQWVSTSLYNVDRVNEKRLVENFTDWTYVGVTSCKTFKPSDTDYTMYVKKENCGFLNLGTIYNIYNRQDDIYYEYRTLYDLTTLVGKLPDIDDSGREKFHLTKKLYYDYLMIPYKANLNGAEVDVYLNYTRYDSEQDNFLTSKSPGANSGKQSKK